MIETPDGARLARDTAKLFKRKPDSEWRDHIEAVALAVRLMSARARDETTCSLYTGLLDPGPWTLAFGHWSRRTQVAIGTGRLGARRFRLGTVRETRSINRR
jgi:hypothetical protein